MLSVSSLIDFLMSLLRDEAAQAEFARDPHGMLARHGLDGLSGQDVRDVAPMLADHPAVQATTGGQRGYDSGTGDDDPVREITYLKENYEVHTTVYDNDVYNLSYIDDRDTMVNVDDRDSTTIVADGDVTIEDSFNQDNDVTIIEDSFNQDNDGLDNKDGVIDDSAAAGDDTEDSANTETSTESTEPSESPVEDTPDDMDEESADLESAA